MLKKLIQDWQGGFMRTGIHLLFFLILFTIFSVSFFGSTVYADHTPWKHPPKKPGLPGYNKACDIFNGYIGTPYEKQAGTGKKESVDSVGIPGMGQLVGQTPEQIKEINKNSFGNRGVTPDCLNHTHYGYPINPGEPGYVDINIPPSSYGRPPNPRDNSSGQYMGSGCDSRQDMSRSNYNKSWESGSCIELPFNGGSIDEGKPCCINTTKDGYRMEFGESGYVVQAFAAKACTEGNRMGMPPGMPTFADRNKQLCDWVKNNSSVPLPHTIKISDDPVERAKIARETAEKAFEAAKAAKLEAEQKLADAETALEKAKENEKAAIDDQKQVVITYKKELEEAENQFNEADAAFMAASRDLQDLEQKLASARTEVTENETAKQGAEQALRQAENEVRRIKGEPELPVVGGSYMGQPGLPVVGGSYMGQPGLPVVGGSYQGPPQ